MNNQTTIESYLENLYDIIDSAWSLPLSGGKVFIDGDEARQILDEMRELIPEEIRKARSIIADQDQIIEEAQKDAEAIGKLAEEKVKAMVNQDEIVRQAQAKANDLIMQGQAKYKEMRKASNDYVDDIMKRADMSVSETLAELRKTRQNIQSAQRGVTNK